MMGPGWLCVCLLCRGGRGQSRKLGQLGEALRSFLPEDSAPICRIAIQADDAKRLEPLPKLRLSDWRCVFVGAAFAALSVQALSLALIGDLDRRATKIYA